MSWVCQGHQHKGEQPPFHFLENILPQSRRLEKCMQDLCHCLGHPWLLHVPETNRLKAFLIDIHWAFSTARNNSHFCIYQAALEFLLWQKWGHRETDFLCALLREGCAATSCFFFFLVEYEVYFADGKLKHTEIKGIFRYLDGFRDLTIT